MCGICHDDINITVSSSDLYVNRGAVNESDDLGGGCDDRAFSRPVAKWFTELGLSVLTGRLDGRRLG